MGLRASDFRRAFLATADLRRLLDDAQADALTVTVARVTQARLDGRNRLVLQWEEDVLALPLNTTNLNALSDAFGDDTDGWINQRLNLWLEATEMNGAAVEGIRIGPAPAPKPAAKPQAPAEGVPPAPRSRPRRPQQDEED